MTIPEAIQILIQRELARTEIYSVLCRVISVDNTERTCEVEPLNGNSELFGVRFQANIELTEGIYIEPKVNSHVIIGFLNPVQALVLQYSEVENVYIDTNGDTIFNGGTNFGMVKVADLVQKLNALETKVNDLIIALQGVVIPLAPSGTYPFAPIFSPITIINPLTQQSDLENTKVQH
jgi:hypothetical protein